MKVIIPVVHGTISATWHDMELDIPEEVIEAGDEAITKWCNANIVYIDLAKVEHQETHMIMSVTHVTLG